MTPEQTKQCAEVATEEVTQAILRAFARMREQVKVLPKEEGAAATMMAYALELGAQTMFKALANPPAETPAPDPEMAEMQALYRLGEMK